MINKDHSKIRSVPPLSIFLCSSEFILIIIVSLLCPTHKHECDLNAFFSIFHFHSKRRTVIVILKCTLTSLPSRSVHFVPSTAVCMTLRIVAVKKDITTAPTRTQIIPNTRPGTDFGVTSPYLKRSIEKNNKQELKQSFEPQQ